MDDPFDWTQLTCPLPMLRVGWRDADDNESDELLRTLGPCGHPLHIYTTSVEYALAGGPSDGAHPWWRVKCEAGHVVFTYDDEGNDYNVPFVFDELHVVLEMIGHPILTIDRMP